MVGELIPAGDYRAGLALLVEDGRRAWELMSAGVRADQRDTAAIRASFNTTDTRSEAQKQRDEHGRAYYERAGLVGYPASVKKLRDTVGTLTTTAAGMDNAVSIYICDVDAASGAKGRNNMCIAVHSISIRFFVENPQTIEGVVTLSQLEQVTANNIFRASLIIDKQPNGALINQALIWNEASVNSALNLDSRKRIRVLRDVTDTLKPRTASFTRDNAADTYVAAVGLHPSMYNWYIPLKTPIRVEYDPDETDGDITKCTQNAMWLFLGARRFTATYKTIRLTYSCRIRFTDCR